MWGCKQQIAFHQKPLLLYLASSPLAIRALIAHEDGGGIDQPVYYISHTLKDAETCYQKAKKKGVSSNCLCDTKASRCTL